MPCKVSGPARPVISVTVETDNTNQFVPTGNAPRRQVLFAVKLAIAGGLLTWLFVSGRLDFSVLGHAKSYTLLAVAGLVLLASMLVLVWRWTWLIRIQGLSISTLTAMRFTWFGFFANMFLPGAAGGDLAKAYAACRHQPSAKTRAVSTVFMDRIFGLHSLLLIGSVAGLCILSSGCSSRQASVVWLACLCFAVASAGLFLLLWRPSSGLALRLLPRRFRAALLDSLGLYRRSWGKLLAIWLYSGFCNALAIASYVLVAAALGTQATLGLILAIPLVILAMSLPISPGGLGVGEVVGSELFSEFGLPNGGLVVLIVRLSIIVFSVPGVVGTFRPARTSKVPARKKEEQGV